MQYPAKAPFFKLYGGQTEWPEHSYLHSETIKSRSSLYDWHIKPHRHSGYYQILHLHSGAATLSFEESRYGVNGPAIVEVPQSFVHGFEFSPDCCGHVLTIAYPLLSDLCTRLGAAAKMALAPRYQALEPGPTAELLHQSFVQLNREFNHQGEFAAARLEAWLLLIYSSICAGSEQAPRAKNKSRGMAHYNRFCELLELNYRRAHQVQWYAQAMHLTCAHLGLVTRAYANKTPLQLIHERIILQACRELIYSPMSVSEIAHALGFNEAAHFTRLFRRARGVAPKQYRARDFTGLPESS